MKCHTVPRVKTHTQTQDGHTLVHNNCQTLWQTRPHTHAQETAVRWQMDTRPATDPTTSSSVQFSSIAQSCPTLCDPWTAAHQASLSITNSQSLPKLTSIESVMPSNHLILCHPLLLPPSIFSSIRDFSNESVLCIKWPKYWSFSFSISPVNIQQYSNEYSGMISFRMDWVALFAVQGTLKSLLQYHSSKASILRHSAFFMIQLSHPYMTTGKTIAFLDGSLLAK